MPGTRVINQLSAEELKKMPTSGLIQVQCTVYDDKMANPQSKLIYLPEVLACAISSRFKDLCEDTNERTFFIDEVLSEHHAVVEGRFDCEGEGIYHYMCLFQKWLYGADISKEPGYCYNRWYMGQMLGCPLFQNEAMNLLCSTAKMEKKRLGDMLIDEYDFDTLQTVWKQADFGPDAVMGYGAGAGHHVYWENKKMLKFILDVFAFVGSKHTTVAKVLVKGGTRAIHLARAIEELAHGGGIHGTPWEGAPWEEENIHKYLVKETKIEIAGQEQAPAEAQNQIVRYDGGSGSSEPRGLKRKLDIFEEDE